MKPAHHRGTYYTNSARVRDAANANPHAVCWRDGYTLAQHPPHKDGKPAKWTAGHTRDGAIDPPLWLNVTCVPPPGPWLAPEASTCNYANARSGELRRINPRSRNWLSGA